MASSPTVIAEGNNPIKDEGKRKVVDSTEGEQSCKMK